MKEIRKISKYIRYILLGIVLSFQHFVYSQNPEQVAVDYFAETILPKLKKTRVNYDGKLFLRSNSYDYYEKLIVDYYRCKTDTGYFSYEEVKMPTKEMLDELPEIKRYKVEQIIAEDSILVIPKGIKAKKILKKKDLNKTTIGYYLENVRNFIFPINYNLIVERAVQFKEDYYVVLNLNKRDFEFGKKYYIRIDDNLNIKDWCEIPWIQ